MARLNVQAAVSWVGNMPDEEIPGVGTFQHALVQLALSVTNQDGAMLEDLIEDSVHVGYQPTQSFPSPDDEIPLSISSFKRHGPPSGGTGWYSCVVSPHPHGGEPSSGWPSSEVFLCVTVKRGADRGQTILLAKYRRGFM